MVCSTNIHINKDDIIKTYHLLNHKNQTEIRLIHPSRKEKPESFFVNNEQEFLRICEEANGKYNIYVGINERKSGGTTKEDVVSTQTIVIDIDPIRQHKNSKDASSEEELKEAEKVAFSIAKDIEILLYKRPNIAMSGNGYQLWFSFPKLELDEKNKSIIEGQIKLFNKKIKQTYENDKISIDEIGDLPRIIKIMGTVSIKGDNTVERPWRLSKWIEYKDREEDKKFIDKILSIKREIKEHFDNDIIFENIDKIKIPPCIKFILEKYKHDKPDNWMRIISYVGAFYRTLNVSKEETIQKLIQWNKKQPYQEDNDEQEIENIVSSVYFRKIVCANCQTLKETGGFPSFNLAELGMCNPDGECENIKNPVTYSIHKYKREEKVVLKDFKNKLKGMTDMKVLIKIFHKENPFFYDKNKLWWIWNKKILCWEMCDEVDLFNHYDPNVENEDTISSKNKNEMIEIMKRIGRLNIPIITSNTWVQFKDEIVDFKTGETFIPHPEFFITNPIPWELGKVTDTPTIDKIFREWVGEDKVQLLYEILAYCCVSDYPIHRIFCFIGVGRNGKSKYLDLIARFVGYKNICSTDFDILLNSRFEVSKLYKKLVCQVGETSFNSLSRTNLLKRLSGQDMIGFEIKGKDPFDAKNYAKLLISTNGLPATSDKSDGWYSRWCLVDFPNKFSEKKDILADIPDEEYNNLALKVVFILKDLFERRFFTNEGSFEERKKQYEEKSNPIKKFVDEMCIGDGENHIFKYQFKEVLCSWLAQRNYREMSDNEINVVMREQFEDKKKYDDNQNYYWAWLGVKWKNGDVDNHWGSNITNEDVKNDT